VTELDAIVDGKRRFNTAKNFEERRLKFRDEQGK
jgi:hypothetical protein